MEHHCIDALEDIDWDGDFVWVQRAPVLTVLAQEDSCVRVRHPDGTEFSLPRSEVQSGYCPERDGRLLKPLYAPLKAHCLDRVVTLRVGGEHIPLGDGDAVFNDEGRISVVRSRVYSRDYVALAFTGTREKPVTPLPDRA